MSNGLVGQRFGRLVVTERHYLKDHRHKKIVYTVACDCGTIKIVHSSALYSGSTNSCGCLKTQIDNSTQYKYRLPPGKAVEGKLWRQYRFNAKTQCRQFEISREQFCDIIKQACHYCGHIGNLNVAPSGASLLSNGLDRVDNQVGYILSNVVPCCIICNRAKRDLSVEAFKVWIERLARWHAQLH